MRPFESGTIRRQRMEKLKNCIQSIFDDDFDRIAAFGSFQDSGDWDSLKFVRLVVSMRSEFGVDLAQEEIQKLTSITSLIDILKARGVAL
jgi:acyl carrier protein